MNFPDRIRILFDATAKVARLQTRVFDADSGEELANVEEIRLDANAFGAEVEVSFRVPSREDARGFKRVAISYRWPNLEIHAVNEAVQVTEGGS